MPYEYIRTVGPLAGITVDGVRGALIGLHRNDPTHRAVSRLDRARATWRHLDAAAFARFVEGSVTDAGDLDMFEASLRLQSEARTDHPLRIMVGTDFVAIKFTHSYGDAGPVLVLLHELIKAAEEGRAASVRPYEPHRGALLRAWWEKIGSKRANWKQGLSLPRPPRAGSGTTRPWKPDITWRTDRSADAMRKIREFRKVHARGVSTTAIVFAAFTAALRDLGVDPNLGGGIFLADARRFLPNDVKIDSDFCMGMWLSPGDTTDPAAIDRVLKAETGFPRILTVMMIEEIKTLLSRSKGVPPAYPGEIVAAPQARITYSHQGRHDMLKDLPWAVEPAERRNISVSTLCEPDGIALGTAEMNGVLHLDAVFHASTFDPEVMAKALHMVLSDPAGLLGATPGGAAQG
ncbi:hypothetical protein [Paractinoplanes ferrugineus]|uniref:hypothetical protein n=1 Tax=Paractinoplanes ferrugineus TaxID=113564 RepID=UPI00194473DF|nr:hypothetical protein [Actinoplanes ferrugineus]